MGIRGKVSKLMRWGNIWCSQFAVAHMDNKKETEDTGRVLLIKVDAIGDFIIWLDSAGEYRKLYSDKKIVLMCSKACADIAKHTGLFDEIIIVDIRKFEGDNAYRKEKIEEFSKLSFDVLIQTAYSRTVHMDMIAAAVPAREKIGFVSDETMTNLSRYISFRFNRKKMDAIYDRLIPSTGGLLMEVKRNGELISGITGNRFLTGMPVLNKYDAAENIIPKGNYYVLFPGASTPKKMWDIKGFAQVADYICEKTGWTGYVCGGPDEAALYTELCRYKKEETLVENYFGRTSLLELSEVIRNARFVVSNDTSGIHFAAAVNTPSVCILGEYNYGRFLPYDCDREYDGKLSPMYICNADMPCKRCATGKMTAECKKNIALTGRYLCVDRVTEAMVIKAVDKILNTYGVKL